MTQDSPIDHVYEIPIRRNKSGQYEYVLPEELVAYHDLSGSAAYWISSKWAAEGRDTSISYSVRPSREKLTNSRSIVEHTGGKATVRFPQTLAVERGFDTRLDQADEPILFIFSPSKGHLEIVPDTPVETISDLATIDQVISKEGFSPKSDGPDRQYTAYRFVVPSQYNRHYGLDTNGYAKWSLALHNDAPALVVEFLTEPSDREKESPLVTRWHNSEAGDVSKGPGYVTNQVQMIVPRVLVTALGWDDQSIKLYPVAGRIIISPDVDGTKLDVVAGDVRERTES